jgi:hypothetical protein
MNCLIRLLLLSGLICQINGAAGEAAPRVISKGENSGTYQAFPDICRLRGGELLCVFYGGYGHISLPNKDWPRGGRISPAMKVKPGVPRKFFTTDRTMIAIRISRRCVMAR